MWCVALSKEPLPTARWITRVSRSIQNSVFLLDIYAGDSGKIFNFLLYTVKNSLNTPHSRTWNLRGFLLNLTLMGNMSLNDSRLLLLGLTWNITPYVFEPQQYEWATCGGQNLPATSCPYCMRTAWVIRRQVTQTDCASLCSIWVHSYVSDIAATYCCSALSSPSEHIVCGATMEICWSRFQKDIYLLLFDQRRTFNQENGTSNVLKGEVWWYYVFSTLRICCNNKLILLKYCLCSKSLIYCIPLSHRPPLLNTLLSI